MDEDDYSALGFMFDAQHKRIEKVISFSEHGNDLLVDFTIALQIIGEDPGHVQSGQYLWPAAKAASLHLMQNWDTIRSTELKSRETNSRGDRELESEVMISALELGAGCGLSGIIASKLPGMQYDNSTNAISSS